MRILHVHTSDYIGGGGGAIAMYRLHLGLKRAGFDSKILCANKTLESSDSVVVPRSWRTEHLLGRVTSRLGLNSINCISSFRIKENRAYVDADVVNLHSFRTRFNYLALPLLTRDKPTVFTLHDMWPFTGHCAVSYDCERWKGGCGACPYLDAPPAIRRDSTRLEWKLKNWVYNRSNLVVVTLSNKQTEQVKQGMLNRFPVHRIPNGLDTEVYQPLEADQCRKLLGIPLDRKVLIFAALDLGQFWKGGDILVEALRALPESLKAETVLLALGRGGEAIAQRVGLEVLTLGYVGSDRLKAICYSAADLLVHPTRADTLSLVVQESMACGTPVVSFRVGGVPDLVRPELTGYLAEPENAKDLCNGIVQLLKDEPARSYMSQQSTKVVREEYSLELQVERYAELYHQLLRGGVACTGEDLVSQAMVAGSA